jgi:hypothetical protein
MLVYAGQCLVVSPYCFCSSAGGLAIRGTEAAEHELVGVANLPPALFAGRWELPGLLWLRLSENHLLEFAPPQPLLLLAHLDLRHNLLSALPKYG